MSSLITELVIATQKKDISQDFLNQGFKVVSTVTDWEQLSDCQILVLDYAFFKTVQFLKPLNLKFKRLVVITSESDRIQPYNFNRWTIHKIFSEKNFSFNHVVSIFDDIKNQEQEETFIKITDQLNEEYERIKLELETKIKEKKENLIESRQKILESNNRTEALRKILFSLFQEVDLNRIETLLNELLPASSKAVWIKIIETKKAQQFEKELKEHLNTLFKSYNLADHSLYFIKADQKNYKKEDLDLFTKICDVIQINISRENEFKKMMLTEKIVSHAFDSATEPILVLNKKYEVVKTNIKNDESKKCFELLHNKTEPCLGCQLGKNFNITENGLFFEVTSNKINHENTDHSYWMNLYSNKTAEHFLEKQIQQNAKMNELGLISSSIAHELNNPIGGLMSYLQLLLMDLPKDHRFYDQIQTMYDTSLRIKKIIEDLLVFSRKETTKEVSTFSLATQLKTTLNVHELSLKTHNIKLVNRIQNDSVLCTTSPVVFNDCIHSMINFFIEKIADYKKQKPQLLGLVEVDFSQDLSHIYLHMQSNCGQFSQADRAKDIRLLALNKIANEQNIQVELFTPNAQWLGLKLAIPNTLHLKSGI